MSDLQSGVAGAYAARPGSRQLGTARIMLVGLTIAARRDAVAMEDVTASAAVTLSMMNCIVTWLLVMRAHARLGLVADNLT